MSYAIIRQAILDRCSLTATYDNFVRHFSPQAIGKDNDGDTNVMAFQYGGGSTKGLPAGGQWRCFRVSGLIVVTRNADPWVPGTGHSKPNTCVTQIDVSV
jgi:hypothetical protein